jgi:importin-4
VKVFRQFIPPILNVSRQCLANGEDDVASIAFEIFDELIESPAPLLGDSVRSIVQFSLEVCSSHNLEVNIRHQVLYLICYGATIYFDLETYLCHFRRKKEKGVLGPFLY